MSWIIGRSAGSTQPSRGRVSLSLHYYQNPQFGMTINKISPSPHPTSRKTIHWIVLLGRVTRGEGIKPLLEITDFGPPARGGHFVLFHSFLPPQPFGTQFHTAHSSPVQLVSLTLPHVGGRENKKRKELIALLPFSFFPQSKFTIIGSITTCLTPQSLL